MPGFTNLTALAAMISVAIFLSYTDLSKAWLLSRRSTAHSSSYSTTTAATASSSAPNVRVERGNVSESDTQISQGTMQPDVEQHPGTSNNTGLEKPTVNDTDKSNDVKNRTESITGKDSTNRLVPGFNVSTTTPANTYLQNFTTLNLTHPMMKNCLETNGHHKVSAREGLVSMTFHPLQFMFIRDLMSCEVEVTVSQDSVAVLQIAVKRDGCGFTADFLIYDTLTKEPLSQAMCGLLVPETFSKSNSLTIQAKLPLMVTSREHNVVFRFKGMAVSKKPGIELHYLTATSGYIQSPGFDGKTQYPTAIDAWLRLDVPAGHDVMISVPHFDVGQREAGFIRSERLRLYKANATHKETLVSMSGMNEMAPTVVHTAALKMRFVTDSSVGYTGTNTGFKILFSFHNNSALPEKLASGKWNCSVPYWPDFRQHFPCNAYPDCSLAEDEVDCPYTTEKCGLGFITAGDSCHFLLMPPDISASWYSGRQQCFRQGARLSTLNTPAEWDAVKNALKLRNGDNVFLGMTSTSTFLPPLYRNIYQWVDGIIAYLANLLTDYRHGRPVCGVLNSLSLRVEMHRCNRQRTIDAVLCELPNSTNDPRKNDLQLDPKASTINLPTPGTWRSDNSHVQCPLRHVTHGFLACDVSSACWGRGYGPSFSCAAPLTPSPPLFTCRNDIEHVPYTLVCDHRPDCGDSSDENFCQFPQCDVTKEFECGNQQCVSQLFWCDGRKHCVTGDDESTCPRIDNLILVGATPPPAVIALDGRGKFSTQALDKLSTSRNVSNRLCPETHFQCPGDGYCLPVYVRCNGVDDCPGREDEAECDNYLCPDFYRCRGSKVCLHSRDLCDDVFQCPQNDDEQYCNLTCPDSCLCYGQAFFCESPFPAVSYPSMRFLNAGGSGMGLRDVRSNSMLIFLSLSKCQITRFEGLDLPNLKILDVSNNELGELNGQDIQHLQNLQELSLAGNPLTRFLLEGQPVLNKLRLLDLSDVKMPELRVRDFSIFPRLQHLNLSNCGVELVLEDGFQPMTELRVLDVRGCPMTSFSQDVFRGLDQLQLVHADNYKLCCPATLPEGFVFQKCMAPSDEISSCDNLLRSDLYRIFLCLFSALGLLGNLVSFFYRVVFNKGSLRQGFGVFVSHLCVSDFFMGAYLAVVGVADRLYQGSYLWEDNSWRHSPACQIAGFLSLLSSEVSTFVICLITLDRFLVLRFPFSRFHFRNRSAHLACAFTWVVGLLMALIPLLPMTSHWQFYSQTGICIPLPITRNDFEGHGYSFGILIVLNFVLFLLIAVGQVIIYWSVRSNRITITDATQKSKDQTIARRLLTVAMSDFLCWFPIGVLGLLASTGTAVPGELNVAMAILVLPLNSALNPFLYTLNMLMERRRRCKEDRLRKLLIAELRGQNATGPAASKKGGNVQTK